MHNKCQEDTLFSERRFSAQNQARFESRTGRATENYQNKEKLLAIIASGLQKHAKLQTKSQLGDRTSYIGMSDIALMSACPRLATLRKREPKPTEEVSLQNYKQILKKQLTLQRGHWLEEGIANALYAKGFQIIPQLEIAVELPDKVPIKIHLGDAEKTEKEEAILYYWPWVKWYTSFLCVGFITRFLRNIDEEEEEDMQYRLLTVGESLDDNRDDGDFWETPFELNIVRSISFV